jgi:hypothetical protein
MQAKWEHFVQMQIYMGKNNLLWSLYCAVSKNTDDLHMELIQYDPTQYQRYLDRSVMIIDATEPPPRINSSPGFYKCKFCDQQQVCHMPKVLPARNCRTCSNSRIADGGKWLCKHIGKLCELSQAEQLAGCDFYEMNPVIKK